MQRTSYFSPFSKSGSACSVAPEYSEGGMREAWESYVAGQSRARPTPTRCGMKSCSPGNAVSTWASTPQKQHSRKIEAEEDLVPVETQKPVLATCPQVGAGPAGAAPGRCQGRSSSDRQGWRIIDAIGDPSVLDEGQNIHLEVGGIWNEDAIGTNGIGTALKTGNRPMSMQPNITARAFRRGPARARRFSILSIARSSASWIFPAAPHLAAPQCRAW